MALCPNTVPWNTKDSLESQCRMPMSLREDERKVNYLERDEFFNKCWNEIKLECSSHHLSN